MTKSFLGTFSARFARAGVFAIAAFLAPLSQAGTLWTGPNISFSHTGPSTNGADTIVPGVALTRNNNNVLINIAAHEKTAGTSSPADTLWGFGSLPNTNVTYHTMESLRTGDLQAVILNQPMILHLLNEDIYIGIKFTTWAQFHNGSFAYTRSTPPPPSNPTVSISTPSAGTIFTAPASVPLTANASQTGGTVTNVEYFAGSTSLGSATTSPFSVSGSISVPGPYQLTAVATGSGLSGTSAVVNITVVAPPTISITNPVDGADFTAPANISIGADASQLGGAVTNVSFYTNSTLLGSVQTPPFTLTVSNLAAGPCALTAVATGFGISVTSSVVNVTVSAPVGGPSVTITNPANNAEFTAPANVNFAADTSGSSGTVTNVAFYTNSVLVGAIQNPPFSIVANNLAAGAYSVTAVATSGGISSTSAAVNITVIVPAPVILAAPAIGGGQFSFNYSTDPGLTYLIEVSSNMVDWTPIATNTPAGNSAQFSDSFVPADQRFYRIILLPNP